LRRERPVALCDPSDLPREAAPDAASARRYGIKSELTLPLVAGGRVLGGLSLATLRVARSWPPSLIGKLQVVAEGFANALARKETEDALRASELMKSAILSSLNSSVGVLDRRGQIIAVNPDWARFAPHRSPGLANAVGVGANYLEVCGAACREIPFSEALAGITGVLNGSRGGFGLEYSYRTPVGE